LEEFGNKMRENILCEGEGRREVKRLIVGCCCEGKLKPRMP
jgi:hypothetical protein